MSTSFVLPAPADDPEIRALLEKEGLKPSPLERFYQQAEWIGHDQYIHFHKNDIAVIGLSPSHPVVTGQTTVTSISWPLLSSTNITGKRKRNAAQTECDTVVCEIKCGEETFSVQAGVRGKLIEVNESLASEMSLLTSDPLWRGYVAVILMWKEQGQALQKNQQPETYALKPKT